MDLLKKINYRVLLISLLIIIQLIWGILFLLKVVNFSEWVSTFFFIFSVLVVLHLNMKVDNASYKIGWIIVVMAFPLLGGLLYLLFGNKRPSKSKHTKLTREHEKVLPFIKPVPEADRKLENINQRGFRTSQYVYHLSDYPLYGNTSTTYYHVGEDMFADMISEMEQARDYIFLEYFIVKEGVMWDQMQAVLERKVKEGVDVRMIYDDVGSMFALSSDFPTRMEALGIKCLPFNRFRPIVSAVMNNRDHRKILVIDGHTGFTGGINISDEYINHEVKLGHWKDTGVMLKGDGAWCFAVMFIEMWNAFRKDGISIGELQKKRVRASEFTDDGLVQPFSDTPLDHEPLAENIFIEILSQAKDYVYIFTPYLIIDNELQATLKLAAKRGVDVRIVTPGIPDKKLIFRVTRSNYMPLLKAGVKIYEYTPGFMHAKSFVCDDKIGVVGTVNMDYRSLYLHFECGVVLYENDSIIDLKNDSLETVAVSKEIKEEDMKEGLVSRVFDAFIRLFAIMF